MNHLISVLVENKPGVLARVATMFAGRGFNIHSLTVGPSEDPALSRMTVMVNGTEMEQVVKQLRKMINTVKVTQLATEEAVEREIMLVRVSAPPDTRTQVLELASLFEAKTVDVGAVDLTFQVVGPPVRLNDFLDLVAPYGIVELVKSGRIALGRASKSKTLRAVG